jgi:hypothetical protein
MYLHANRRRHRVDVVRRREQYGKSTTHSRTPTILANLEAGWSLLIRFARERKALTMKEAKALRDRGAAALKAVGAAQGQHLAANDPVARFVELLSSVIASGRAHLASAQGGAPPEPQAWGWRQERSGDTLVWKPQGDRVGWLDEGNVYLEPEASYTVVQKVGNDAGDGISLSSTTMRKRLHERHMLVSTDEKRGKLTVRRTLEGKRRDVIHLVPSALHSPKPAQSAHRPCEVPNDPRK